MLPYTAEGDVCLGSTQAAKGRSFTSQRSPVSGARILPARGDVGTKMS